MVANRSVPPSHLLPQVFYEDVAAALNWLTSTLGFSEYYRFKLPDGTLHGAMIYLGEAWVMLKSPGRTSTSPNKLGHSTQSLMIFVENVDAHREQSRSGGAVILEELFDTEYGERQYTVQDPQGHPWTFATHIRDVSPDAWGAIPAATRDC
ncbi:VOC family protein [Paenibacillus glycanilyticus]|uniref:VOC family protein n=1 Tax=Paenibacillus glycanilyticus TaxID=126569 RepID=UPI00203D2727|nr:VOC family protein [Paenibacillus glycanilyticus]MCM3629700.1 VOC family protein [Paenibacillus glycanilyticus]